MSDTVQLGELPLSDRLAPIVDAVGPEVLSALDEAAADSALWDEASEDPRAFLANRGVRLPEDVEIRLDASRPEIPWPRPEPQLERVSWRTFWFCYFTEPNPKGKRMRVCVRVTLQAPVRR